MSRRDWYIGRIVAAYHEFIAADVAVGLLQERLRADPSFLFWDA